jgi:hypothetical protein
MYYISAMRDSREPDIGAGYFGGIMKHVVSILLILFALGGCGRSRDIEFCEGITPEGKGVKCGKKFTTGELSALVTSREQFGVQAITLKIFRIHESRDDLIETLALKVKPDNMSAFTNLSFYNEGRYRVKAMKNDEAIGEGDVEIVGD